MRTVKWERLGVLRTPVMVAIGLIFAVVGAFQFGQGWGWLAAGAAVLLFAYLTDAPTEGDGATAEVHDLDARRADTARLDPASFYSTGASR